MKNLSIHAQGRPATSRAFTIIELLVVIAIMALLTGIVMTSLTGSKAKSRDTKRISDMGQIQLALELFFDRCKQYPVALATGYTCPSVAVTLGTYISTIPKDPYGVDYEYFTNNTTEPSIYLLHTQLESPTEILKDSFAEADRASLPIYDVWASTTCYDSGDPASMDYCLVPK